MSLSVLSLFAGIGGIDLGLERIGKFQTVAYSEIDDYACRIMQQHFPNAVNIGDVTEIDWTTVQPVDVIVGGFPCQDISLAGKGAGINGERSGLWSHYADAIRTLRPRGVIVENVAALLHRGIDRVLGDLASCGYDAEWDCLPAAAVGAPHLRDRLFIVAYRSDLESGADKHAWLGSNTSCGRGSNDKLRAGRNEHWGSSSQQLATNSTSKQNRWLQQQKLSANTRASSETIANPNNERCEERDRSTKPVESELAAARGTCKSSAWKQPSESEWWSVEPEMGRVAHGIPRRVDRLRCLGNAVVPQVAEHVGRILLDRIGEA